MPNAQAAPGVTASICRLPSRRDRRSAGSGKDERNAQACTPSTDLHSRTVGAEYRRGGIAVPAGQLAASMSIGRLSTLRCPGWVESSWTARYGACDALCVTAADPLLVARRHVDLLRVRSAICRHGR